MLQIRSTTNTRAAALGLLLLLGSTGQTIDTDLVRLDAADKTTSIVPFFRTLA